LRKSGKKYSRSIRNEFLFYPQKNKMRYPPGFELEYIRKLEEQLENSRKTSDILADHIKLLKWMLEREKKKGETTLENQEETRLLIRCLEEVIED